MIALPDAERLPEVAKAAAVLEAREADLAAAQQELREAKAGVESARAEDRLEYARSRDAGGDDPGARHLELAHRTLEDVERRHGGEMLRVGQSQAALDAALTEHLEVWREALEAALECADRESLKLLERFESAERDRAALRGALAWTQRPSSAPKPGGPVPSGLRRNLNSPETFSVDELLAAVRTGLMSSTLEAARQRAVERGAAELEAEQRREQRRQMTEQAIPR